MTAMFEPPLRIKDTIIVTLDDAARFLAAQPEQSAVHNRTGILRKLQAATTPEQQKNAADAFIGWLHAEGLSPPGARPEGAGS